MNRYKRFVYIQWNTTQPSKNNEILPFAKTWMELEDILLSEIIQSEKDNDNIVSLLCGI